MTIQYDRPRGTDRLARARAPYVGSGEPDEPDDTRAVMSLARAARAVH